MISDVLSDAVRNIKYYLTEPTYQTTYDGEMRAKLNKLLLDMDALRQELDTPPSEVISACKETAPDTSIIVEICGDDCKISGAGRPLRIATQLIELSFDLVSKDKDFDRFKLNLALIVAELSREHNMIEQFKTALDKLMHLTEEQKAQIDKIMH